MNHNPLESILMRIAEYVLSSSCNCIFLNAKAEIIAAKKIRIVRQHFPENCSKYSIPNANLELDASRIIDKTTAQKSSHLITKQSFYSVYNKAPQHVIQPAANPTIPPNNPLRDRDHDRDSRSNTTQSTDQKTDQKTAQKTDQKPVQRQVASTPAVLVVHK